MFTKLLFPILAFLPFSIITLAQKPQVLLLDSNKLVELKAKIKTDKKVRALVNDLVAAADQLLAMRPVSVMDKAFTPASGSKHDYMSQAPYFWYDSTKPYGLPYMRKDGERNPEILKITDRKNLG
jgi:hypothetical protein